MFVIFIQILSVLVFCSFVFFSFMEWHSGYVMGEDTLAQAIRKFYIDNLFPYNVSEEIKRKARERERQMGR